MDMEEKSVSLPGSRELLLLGSCTELVNSTQELPAGNLPKHSSESQMMVFLKYMV